MNEPYRGGAIVWLHGRPSDELHAIQVELNRALYMDEASLDRSDGFDRLEVYGNGYVARVSSNPRPIELWDEKANWPMALEIRADLGGPSGMMAEELRCFCRVVRGMQPVPLGATYGDAMQVQRWIDRLEKAADV